MRRAVALALALLAAGPVQALKCAPPDPLRSLREAQDSPDRYVVLRGRLDFDPALMPPGGYVATPPAAGGGPAPRGSIPARLVGEALTAQGFTRPFAGELLLAPRCAGPWCGGGLAPGDRIVFARETPAGWEVELAPCGTWAFDRWDAGVPEAMASCLARGAC